jgi:aminoglycoside 3-N-acetyltransferase
MASSRQELVEGFSTFLDVGDVVIVHSSLRSMGRVEGGAGTVIAALLQVIGSTGNLMLPTFNYTKPLPTPFFDPQTTASRTGLIPETGRQRPDAVRSLHPTHSVAVIGPLAEALTTGHLESHAFGIGSPIDRLMDLGGKILLIGVGHTSNSALHVVEEHAQRPKAWPSGALPVLRIRLAIGDLIEHRLDASASCSHGFGAAEAPLRAAGAIRDGRVAHARCQLIDGAMFRDVILLLMRKHSDALLCDRPGCAHCRGTRQRLAEGAT